MNPKKQWTRILGKNIITIGRDWSPTISRRAEVSCLLCAGHCDCARHIDIVAVHVAESWEEL